MTEPQRSMRRISMLLTKASTKIALCGSNYTHEIENTLPAKVIFDEKQEYRTDTKPGHGQN